jgi:hypothetical protein
MSVATDQEAEEFLRQAQEFVCVCDHGWWCLWHGMEGRGVLAPLGIPLEYLSKPYPREEDHVDPWKYTRPKDASSNGSKPKKPKPESMPLDEASRKTLDAIDAEFGPDVRYAITARWTGCREMESWVYSYRSRAERRITTMENATKHKGRSGWHSDTATVNVEAVVSVAPEETRVCECGCGETFVVRAKHQQYVDGTHRVRGWRATSHVDVTQD